MCYFHGYPPVNKHWCGKPWANIEVFLQLQAMRCWWWLFRQKGKRIEPSFKYSNWKWTIEISDFLMKTSMKLNGGLSHVWLPESSYLHQLSGAPHGTNMLRHVKNFRAAFSMKNNGCFELLSLLVWEALPTLCFFAGRYHRTWVIGLSGSGLFGKIHQWMKWASLDLLDKTMEETRRCRWSEMYGLYVY